MGLPGPGLTTTPGVAAATTAAFTWAAVSVGSIASLSAATPATCGDAIEVPLSTAVAVSLVFQALVMPTPGAKRSRQVP